MPSSDYHQNLYDRRYCLYVSCAFEKAYNYWDRIGDMLYSFYPTLLTEIKQVDFARIIDKIYAIGERHEDFIKLYNFRITEFSELNKFRKDVVHYYQYETTYHYDHLMNKNNFDQLEILWTEKNGFAIYFKQQLEYSCDGYFWATEYLGKVKLFRDENNLPMLPSVEIPAIPIKA